MGKVIHRGAAGVHFHMAGSVGGEFGFFVGGGIIEIHGDSPFWFSSVFDAGQKNASRAGMAREAAVTAVPLSFLTQMPVTWANRGRLCPRAPGRTSRTPPQVCFQPTAHPLCPLDLRYSFRSSRSFLHIL